MGVSTKVLAGCSAPFSSKENLKKYNFVIVPGIFNEIVPYYMTEYRRYLLEAGVSDDQILRVNNGTRQRPEEASLGMLNKLMKMDQGKEFVFLSHSKGALETLYMLLDQNQRIKLKRLYLIQGALDGSSLYRLIVLGEGRGVLLGAGRLLGKIPYIREYSKSFSSDFVRQKMKGVSTRRDLLSKTVFIESDKSYKDLSFKFKLVGGFYNKTYQTSGDGILLKSDHLPFELQGDEGVCRKFYEADHGDLVKAAPWEKGRILRIKEFLDEILFGFKRNEKGA